MIDLIEKTAVAKKHLVRVRGIKLILHKKWKFFIKDLFSKCDQIYSFLNGKLHFLCSVNDTNTFAHKLFLYKKSDLLFIVFEFLETTCTGQITKYLWIFT